MTTYGDNTTNRFYGYVRPDYRYTYALIDQYAGDVRTSSCDKQFVPLHDLYNRFDSLRREYARDGLPCHLILVNCRTGEVIAQEGGAA